MKIAVRQHWPLFATPGLYWATVLVLVIVSVRVAFA
jgi:hypothetical protein